MSKTNSMCLRVKHPLSADVCSCPLLLCRVILQLLHFTLELYREEEEIKSITLRGPVGKQKNYTLEMGKRERNTM